MEQSFQKFEAGHSRLVPNARLYAKIGAVFVIGVRFPATPLCLSPEPAPNNESARMISCRLPHYLSAHSELHQHDFIKVFA
jgi:hypothetical protein